MKNQDRNTLEERHVHGRYVTPILLILLIVAGIITGCRRTAPDVDLLPVTLPPLVGLAEEAQQQVQVQYERALNEDQDSDSLGAEWGILGQLLLAYDFLNVAEPALLNAQSLMSDDNRWTFYLGVLYRKRGDFEEAVNQFETILEETPDDSLIRLRLAEVYLELGRTELAQTHLESLSSDFSSGSFARFLFGQIAYEEGDYQEAVDFYKAALELQPGATQVHAPLGLAYRNLGDMEQSRLHMTLRGTEPLQLSDPRMLDLERLKFVAGATDFSQGIDLLNAGRFEEAVVALERAAAQDPTGSSKFLNLGVVYARLGAYDRAIAAFNYTLQLDSTKSKAHYNLGAIFALHGQLEQAEHHFLEAARTDPRNAFAHLELGELYRKSGRFEQAISRYERMLTIVPRDIQARQHQALCHLRLNEFEAALTLLEAGLAANPDHVGFLDALARILATSTTADIRDGERAFQLAYRALTIEARAETFESLAMAYAELGRYDDAVASQEQALLLAGQLGNENYISSLEDNKRRYERNTPCRSPWPEFIYVM